MLPDWHYPAQEPEPADAGSICIGAESGISKLGECFLYIQLLSTGRARSPAVAKDIRSEVRFAHPSRSARRDVPFRTFAK